MTDETWPKVVISGPLRVESHHPRCPVEQMRVVLCGTDPMGGAFIPEDVRLPCECPRESQEKKP